MVKPYSNDLRSRAVAAMSAGEPASLVAERFGVAKSSVIKWHLRFRQTGSVAPGKMGGHRKPVLDPHRDFIIDAINNTSHLTLHGLKDLLDRRVSAFHTMQYGFFLSARGLASKKTLFDLEQGRADVARRRRRWKSFMGQLDPSRLVFIDETWIKTNMAPIRGWSRKGQRLRGFAPHGHWNTMTFIAALR